MSSAGLSLVSGLRGTSSLPRVELCTLLSLKAQVPGPFLRLGPESLDGHWHSPVSLARPMPRIKGIPGNSTWCQALLVWICLTGSENVPRLFQKLLRFSLFPETCEALGVVKRIQESKQNACLNRSTTSTPWGPSPGCKKEPGVSAFGLV